jgi:hypothetical protein
MKAALIKKDDHYFLQVDFWYPKYIKPSIVANTFDKPEEDVYQLSKQNCDEIFGVVNVEKLAGQEVFQEYYDWGGEVFSEDYLISKRLHFIEGFNKAMELNKDKVFTVEDMHEALHLMNNTPRVPIASEALEIVRKETEVRESIVNAILVSKQPTEIEVEIEMEVADLAFYENGERHPIKANLPERFKYKPKLDSDGCLILKKI